MNTTPSNAVDANRETPTRRSLLSRAAGAAAAVSALALFHTPEALAVSPALKFADIPGEGDVKVLNYALLLEQLETVLYNQAATRLLDGGFNQLGKKVPGLKLNPSSRSITYLLTFAVVERQHRNFIHDALGAASVLKKAPFNNIRFDFGIENLTAKQVMNLVYTAERTGVGAYLGAIPRFETKTFLQIAGAIQGTEARHTAAIAQAINLEYNGNLNVAPLFNQNNGIDSAINPDTVLATVSPFIVL